MLAAVHEEIVAGGQPGDFCMVRHLRLSGNQEDIGSMLAELAERNFGIGPQPAPDPILTRARRRWRNHFYPELAARARGIAGRWDVDADDDRFETAMLRFGFPAGGCSVAWIPPERTVSGTPLVSRNFDFTTQTLSELQGRSPASDEPILAGPPYIIETYPDEGHATLIVCLFDLASGAVDGINDAGLVAALLADGESTNVEPTHGPQAGLGEHEICRYLLETCEAVDDAVEALRVAKQYYEFVPCHYLVADRSGRAFVWEHSAAHNREHIVWADGPQVVTNHLLHRYATLGDLPSESGNGATYDRARLLAAAIDHPGPLDPEQLKDLHACVRIDEPGEPVRTLWHAVYDPATLAMNISFHLADAATGERRSPYQAFRIDSQRAPGSSNVPETPSAERKTGRGAVV